MGLVKCPDCHREVSDMAPVCIHCGRPKPGDAPKPEEPPPPPKKKPKRNPDVLFTLGGGALLATGLLLLVAGSPGYAGLGLLLGLLAVLVGGVWGWLKRE